MFFILIVLTQSQRADTRTAPIPDQRFGAICTKVLTRKKELRFKYQGLDSGQIPTENADLYGLDTSARIGSGAIF